MTDDFNEAHAEFIKNYCIDQNKEGLPFCIESIGFKVGSDMVVESPRLRLVEDLLKEGHTVYVRELDEVISQFQEELVEDYDDRIIFIKSRREIHEPFYMIDL